MIGKLIHLCVHLILIAMVAYFGYYYFTHQTAGVCVVAPMADLIGKAKKNQPDKQQVDNFLTTMGDQANEAAKRGMALSDYLSSTSSAETINNSGDLFDIGQYYYCKMVVTKAESAKN